MRTASVSFRVGLAACSVVAAVASIGLSVALGAESTPDVYDCYTPIPGGYRIRLTGDPAARRADPKTTLGAFVADGNAASPRLHRRPLYPPTDRSMFLTPEQIGKVERFSFRPLVLAYNEPRFTFDYSSAGGLMGFLFLGLTVGDGPGKWLHQCSEVEVTYTRGRMEYRIGDPLWPGATIELAVAPLASSAGAILRIRAGGMPKGAALVWMYGGASTYYTNWNMLAPEFQFAPKHCALDRIAWADGAFTLTRGFDKRLSLSAGQISGDGSVMDQVFAIPKALPGWKTLHRGGSSFRGRVGFGEPAAVLKSPGELLRATAWCDPANAGPPAAPREKENCVAVERIALADGNAEGFVVQGFGGDVDRAIRNPREAWAAALARNDRIADRVVTHTPDAHLDAAMPMMAFATEGLWGDVVVLHGAWSWRFGYAGWRGGYGVTAYGWADRMRTSIRNHCRLSVVREGPDQGGLGSLVEYSPGVFYNMGEVFLDMVRQYFDYTDDRELAREIFPVLEGIVAWENRRLRPTGTPLYENALNTWISDQHWYTRAQCAQASAYMLRAYSLLGDLAVRLNKNPAPYCLAQRGIRIAMQKELWQVRPGVFAESRDTRGNRLLHPEPELPSLYHPAEFGAVVPHQVYEMLHWADTHLKAEQTPGGGKLVWSSNWLPNMGREPTHSTYELNYADQLNFALTNYQAGRSDEGYRFVRSAICGIFNGPTPGGLCCHAHRDGRGRANDEFADAIGMWGRTVIEGLFGIVPKRPDGRVELSPQFPRDWPTAAIETPQFAYRWERKRAGQRAVQRIDWTSPVETAVRLRLPLTASRLEAVTIDGRPAQFSTELGVGLTWLTVNTRRGRRGAIEVEYVPADFKPPPVMAVKQGQPVRVPVPGGRALFDPQGLLTKARLDRGTLEGIAQAAPGPGVLFVESDDGPLCGLTPIRLAIEPETPPIVKRWSPPKLPSRDLRYWTPIDLAGVYNAALPEVTDKVRAAVKPPPLPASDVNTNYYKSHLDPEYWITPKLSDAAWRKKVGADGIAWTTDGIPFRTSKAGPNIAVVTLEGAYPARVEFPVRASGRSLYLMLSGVTFAMQSHVVNLRVTLRYADGSQQPVDLVNPLDIGDCWGQYRFHDTAAAGFENLAGRFGPAGSAEVKDLSQPIKVDVDADLVEIAMKPNAELRSVALEAIANDVIFGVMGATVLK